MKKAGLRKYLFQTAAVLLFLFAAPSAHAASGVAHNNCTNCHEGQAAGAPSVVGVFRETSHSTEITITMPPDQNQISSRCRRCHNTKSDAQKLLKIPFSNLCLECHPNKANVVGSKHDISYTSPTPYKGACMQCHTPHPSSTDTPLNTAYLWIRNIVDEVNLFNQTSSPNYVVGSTILCYDCHSSTNADDDPQTATFDATKVPEDIAFSEDGSGGVTGYYETTTGGHYIKSVGATGINTGDKLPCGACHDLHNTESSNEAFIKSPLAGQAVTNLKASPASRNGTGNGREICNTCHGLGVPGDTSYTPSVLLSDVNPNWGGITVTPKPVSVGEHSPAGTQPCTNCHAHNRIDHGGAGAGSGCRSCHGHDAGYEYEPGKFSQGTGTSRSHSTHTENDADDKKGPNVNCDTCHDTGSIPWFKSGTDQNGDNRYSLEETDVCDGCHSPGGDYDGVNDPVIGAKNNWDTGIYQTTDTLNPGKDKWCAGCHDFSSAPSVIQGVKAPPVVGDETSVTPYGTGFGFYETGHGLAGDKVYPWTKKAGSSQERQGAGLNCDACHDFSMSHIDGLARTYAAPGTPAAYQAGYRLKSVGGGYPLEIPRKYSAFDDPVLATDFKLCFQCHVAGRFIDAGNKYTNYRNESTTPSVNRHYTHLSVQDVMGPGPMFWSDWTTTGGYGDSRTTCIQCHNVHGSRQLSMVNDGFLVGKEPGLPVRYAKSLSNVPAGLTLPDSSGTVWAPDDIEPERLCTWACHGGPPGFSAYYPRKPFDGKQPTIKNRIPEDGAVNAPRDINITFTLEDMDSGVDFSTPAIQLTGSKGYSKSYTAGDTAVVSKTGTPASYDVTVNPDVDFGYEETITVEVNFSDYAGNSRSSQWSFVTVPFVTGDAVQPVSNIVSPVDNDHISGGLILISGTSTDGPGGDGVTLVEVSTNGGISWLPAGQVSGYWDNWEYGWLLPAEGQRNIRSRAADANGNIEFVSQGINVIVDNTSPTASALDPANNDIGVPIDSNLSFSISDAGGADWSTFQIQLIGSKGYNRLYSDEDTAVVSKTGDLTAYNVTVDPNVNFALDETITVTLSIADLAGNNLAPPDWTFKTGAAAAPQTVVLHPSGLAAQSVTWGLVGGTWATALDGNDGDDSYAHYGMGSGNNYFYVDLDNPIGLATAQIQSVKIVSYSQYVDPPLPGTPVSGNMDIGYQTGAATQWKGSTTLSGGGYIKTESATYTVDSDGGQLDLNDINNLKIAVKRYVYGPPILKVTEVFAEVTYIPAGGGAGTFIGIENKLRSFTGLDLPSMIDKRIRGGAMTPKPRSTTGPSGDTRVVQIAAGQTNGNKIVGSRPTGPSRFGLSAGRPVKDNENQARGVSKKQLIVLFLTVTAAVGAVGLRRRDILS